MSAGPRGGVHARNFVGMAIACYFPETLVSVSEHGTELPGRYLPEEKADAIKLFRMPRAFPGTAWARRLRGRIQLGWLEENLRILKLESLRRSTPRRWLMLPP